MKGLFVSLDGPGGAGKTTLARLVTDQLTAARVPVHATAEMLTADDIPVVTFDATTTHAESLATSLTNTILALRSSAWSSATAPPSTST